MVEDATNKILGAWGELAPAATFGGMTLAQYTAKVQPSLDSRRQIAKLQTDLKAEEVNRDKLDAPTSATNDKVIKSVVADDNFGDDSALYEGMGYIRKSARASGLTRKAPAPAPQVKA